MKEMTEKNFWDSVHEAKAPTIDPVSTKARVKARLKRLLGERLVGYSKSYRNHILWNVLYKKYLPTTGVKLLEVGSAPGDHLVRLQQIFGVDPYGVEFSDTGVERNRQAFEVHNIDPEHVIHDDFLAAEFVNRHEESFDVVVSIGFVEHFSDPCAVIERHLRVLKKGGTFMISVPNFRGINYFLLWFFQKELIPLHNFEIMEQRVFKRCFTKDGVHLQFCGYYGTFDFELFSAKVPWKRFIWDLCIQLQHVVNLLCRLIFGNKGPQGKFFSPVLIAIGVKE